MKKTSTEGELSCAHLTRRLETAPNDAEALKRALQDFDMLLDTQDVPRLNRPSVVTFLSEAATWILKNSASAALSGVVRLVHKLLKLHGHSAEFSLDVVFASEMRRRGDGVNQDQDDDNDDDEDLDKTVTEQEEGKGKEATTSSSSKKEDKKEDSPLLTPSLASAVLSLLLSILGKDDPSKYKGFVGVLVEMSAFFMRADRAYQRSYRKHKALKALLLFMKGLLEDAADQGGLLTTLAHFYAGAAYGSGKNQDYLLSKGLHKWVLAFLAPGRFPPPFVRAATMLLGTLPGEARHRALLVGDGGVTRLLALLKTGLDDKDAGLLSSTLYALWSLCADCEQAQEQVWAEQFPTIALKLLQQHPADLGVLAFTLGLLRKGAKTPPRRAEVAKHFLRTLLALLKAFGQALGTGLKKDRRLAVGFLLKEIVGLLGVLAADDAHRVAIAGEDGLLETLLSISLRCLQFAKLLKTTLGLLINLSVSAEGLALLAEKPDFYALLYLSLKHYPRSQPLMDYVLKLALNLSNSETARRNLGAGSFFTSACQLLSIHRSSLPFLAELCHLLHELIALPQLARRLVEEAAKAFNPGLAGFTAYLADLLTSASAANHLELFVATTLLTAGLCNASQPFETALLATPGLFPLFEKALADHRNDRPALQLLSEAIATLPVEGFEASPLGEEKAGGGGDAV